MNEAFLEFKKSKTKSYQDEDGQVHCIQQANKKSNLLKELFLLVLFRRNVHIPRPKSCSSSVFLRSCSHSESLELMERGHEVGRVDPLGSVQVPNWINMKHMQICTSALHKSPPGLLHCPKCCNSQSLQKTPLQILLFSSAAKFTFYSFLSSLILRRVRTEVCLLEST